MEGDPDGQFYAFALAKSSTAAFLDRLSHPSPYNPPPRAAKKIADTISHRRWIARRRRRRTLSLKDVGTTVFGCVGLAGPPDRRPERGRYLAIHNA
jgi:hypothetical protein